jgi:hypothetical protein
MTHTHSSIVVANAVICFFSLFDLCCMYAYSIFAWTRGLAHRAKLDDNKELRVSYTIQYTNNTLCSVLAPFAMQ